ncbi:MAG: hypothetical protein AAF747_11375, partial [Planctomycetota bacterium]
MDKPTLGSELIRISLESRSRAQRLSKMSELEGRIVLLDEDTKLQVTSAMGGIGGVTNVASNIFDALIAASSLSLDNKIDEFLNDRSGAASFGERQLTGEAATLLTAMARNGEYSRIDEVIDHTLMEVRRLQGRGRADGEANSTIAEYLLEESSTTPELFGFAIRVLGDAPSGTEVRPWILRRGVTSAIESAADDLDGDEPVADALLASSETDIDDDQAALRHMLMRAEAVVGDADTLSLATALVNSGSLGFAELQPWLEELPSDNLFWRDARGATSLMLLEQAQREAKAEADEADDGDSREPIEPTLVEAASKYLAEVVARASAVESSRVVMVGGYLDTIREAEGDWGEMVRAALAMTPATLETDAASSSRSWLVPLLAAIVESDADEAWPESEAVLDAIFKAATRARQSGDSDIIQVSWPFSHEWPDSRYRKSLGVLTTELALRLGDDETTERLVRTPMFDLSRDMAVVVALAEAGKTELTAGAIGKSWQRTLPSLPKGLAYSERLHANVPAVVNAIEDSDVQLFAKALFAIVPDAESADASSSDETAANIALPSRAERVADVIAELPPAASDDMSKAAMHAMLVLTAAEPALDALADRLVERALQLPGDRRLAISDGWRELSPDEVVFMAAIRAEMRRGKLDVIRQTMNDFADRAGRNTPAEEMIGRGLDIFANGIVDAVTNEEAPIAVADIMALVDELLARPAIANGLDHHYRTGSAIEELTLLYAAIAAMQPDAPALATFSDEQSTIAKQARDEFEMRDVLARVKRLTESASEAEKLRVVTALATSEHLTGFHDDHDYFIKQAHDEGLLTDAQVIEQGMAMAKAIGEPGWMGLGFALDEAGAGEASDAAWRRVMQTEKADGDELHYIEHMIESNRFDLA